MPGIGPLLVVSVVALTAGTGGAHRNGRIAFTAEQQVGNDGLVSISPSGGRLTSLFPAPEQGPVVSPDGTRLALEVGGSLSVERTDATGFESIGTGAWPTWSPDGSRVAFDAATGELEIAPATGNGPVRDLGVSGGLPAWSPSGEWIAFYSNYTTLELIHPDGTGRTVLARDAVDDPEDMPAAWSHDGTWISFGAVNTEIHTLELNIVRVDGSARRWLGPATRPVWSPTSDVLAFLGSQSGVEIAAPDGSVLTTSADAYGTPVWSPAGDAVAVGTPDLPGVWIVDLRTRATRHVSMGGVPTWSPDGTRIAAARGSILRVAARNGGRPRVVTRGANGPALWLRNGRIAFLTQPRFSSVIEIARDGGFPRPFLHGPAGFGAAPAVELTALAWAPDGSALAYRLGSELRVVAADGKHVRRLAHGVTGTPAWSPDGHAIAFAATDGLRVVAASGGRSRLIASVGRDTPAWSPDGHRLAFLGDRGNVLYVVDSDGHHLQHLADDVSSAPSWSPDGTRIAFSTGDDYGPTAVEIIRYDGRGRVAPATATADDTGDVVYGPRWSPDGKTILYFDDEYFCGSKCDELHLMLMRVDGSGKRRLMDDALDASWSPDGRELLVHSAADDSLFTFDLLTGRHRFLSVPTESWSWQPLP